MSYILDALRKSDQQRQRGATPTLLTLQATAAEPGQTAYWFYGLIAVVLVGAGIVIGWLHPWQSEQAAPVADTIDAKPLESGLRRAAPAPLGPAPVSVSPGSAMAQDRPAPSVSNAQTRGTPHKSAVSANTGAMTPVPEKTVNVGPADPAREQRVMTMGELPLSIRQELPGMQISVHLYSTKPRNSFVSINSRMLQEGDDLAPGISLEQITPDGMIFSYKGYRFSRGVQQ
jgi:general secretion pathway protein B